MYLSKFDKVLSGFTWFYVIFNAYFCEKFSIRAFWLLKEFAFRQSAYKTVVDGACTYGDNFWVCSEQGLATPVYWIGNY